MGTSYKDAGVDIDAGDALVERIRPLAARTQRPEVLSHIASIRRYLESEAPMIPNALVVAFDKRLHGASHRPLGMARHRQEFFLQLAQFLFEMDGHFKSPFLHQPNLPVT